MVRSVNRKERLFGLAAADPSDLPALQAAALHTQPGTHAKSSRSVREMRRALGVMLVTLLLAAAPLHGCQAARPHIPRQLENESRLASPRGSTYKGDVSTRWSHASVIADLTMYVVGGKSGMGDTANDYATPCISLNLATKFTTDNPPWSSTCGVNAPSVAGHSMAINSKINMVIVYGGTTPASGPGSGPGTSRLNLFSAEIKFWSIPHKLSKSLQPLLNHTACVHSGTGDMLVYGGVLLNSANHNAQMLMSNSTLRMVTDPAKHIAVPVPPAQVVLGSGSSGGESDSSSSRKPSSVASSSSPPQPSGTSLRPSDMLSQPSSIPSSSSPTDSPTLPQPTSTLETTSRKSTTTKRSSSTSRRSSTKKSSSTKAKIVPTPDDSELDNRALPIVRDDRLAPRLLRRSDDDSDLDLMSWINDTLPTGMSGRIGHTSNIVSSGRMVVLGGSDGTSLVDMDTVFFYDSVSRQWTRLVATGHVPTSRRSHVSTVVNGSKIVVHGGVSADFGSALSDVAVLDTETWTWSAPDVANAPTARYAHAAAQAGPYMLITFGYAPSDAASVAAGDSGLYILDTTSWQFVTQYDPARAGLAVLSVRSRLSSGTIFGLFIASLASLIVLIILGYIGCMHYYNKHPRLSDSGEGTAMLPTSELRDLGRRLTGKFGTQRQRNRAELRRTTAAASKKPSGGVTILEPTPVFGSGKMRQALSPGRSSVESGLPKARRLSNVPPPAVSDETNLRIMFDLSRESSLDQDAVADGKAAHMSGSESASLIGTRFSRRIHLDDVRLPAGGLRTRHNMRGISRVADDDVSVLHTDTQSSRGTGSSDLADGGWSRPTTSDSSLELRSNHISAMLPRIVGSRLTLPAESANALARYRFDELEDGSQDGSATQPRPAHSAAAGQQATIAALVGKSRGSVLLPEFLAPPVMPAAHYEGAPSKPRYSVGEDATGSPALTRAKLSTSSVQGSITMRDSIDINTVLSQNRQFYVANPDD
ncbi:hypothetical protein GGH93_001466 [Coemansia aciculifera]|nr:hypothetical protein GGH93_001466 [Coemansia aciculifera]